MVGVARIFERRAVMAVLKIKKSWEGEESGEVGGAGSGEGEVRGGEVRRGEAS